MYNTTAREEFNREEEYELRKEFQMGGPAPRFCPDCHMRGFHVFGCPNDPSECDETPEQPEDEE